MRYFSLGFTLVFALPLFSQNTNVAFRSKLTYPGQELANIWGYAANGREYALVGAYNGLSIVDVTDADNPVEIVQIPGAHSDWHEIKTYGHYAYIVSEGGMGVQIVDLANLPGSNLAYHSYLGDGAINNLLPKAHALHVDVTKGYLYVYGCQTLFSGKPVVLNLNTDPYNPTYVNYVNFVGYAHDGYVDNDILYTAHIYAGLFAIVDMTNKSNPLLLATQSTPNAFTHNTWPSGSTLFTTDEKSNSFLAAYNISNPSNITLLDKIQSAPGSNSIVHNTHILDDYAITSWYRDGFTITDVARPANLVQVGNYDTYPNGSGNGFDGAWGVYPFLPSGNILVSNIAASGTTNGELWVLTPTYVRGCYIEGTITNASTGLPLNGAKVQLLSTTTVENSASNGQYKMGQLQSGTFTAQVSKSGYYTQNTSVTLANGLLTPLNVALLAASLPVELVDFEVHAQGRTALLHWQTASETNHAGFEIEHSLDGISWQLAGSIPAHGVNAAAEYEFQVAALLPGNHFFRLRQIDLDGASQYSDVRTVGIRGDRLQVELLPNMVRESCMLHIRAEQAGTLRIEVFQADGQPTGLHWIIPFESETSYPFPLAHLPAGTYFVALQTDRERQVLPLVKE